MRIIVFGDAAFSSQAALVTQLNALHAANKAVFLVTAGRTPVDGWARAWAQANGVPWDAVDDDLDASGYAGPSARALAAMRMGNVDTVLTASGSATGSSTATTVQAVATTRGHTLSAI